MSFVSSLAWVFPVIAPSPIAHQRVHGWKALALGDPAARGKLRWPNEPRTAAGLTR